MTKTLLLSLCLIPTMFFSLAFAEESLVEKAQSVGNATIRAVKKGTNRISEAVCNKEKAECAGEKLKNRAQESKDAVLDGAKELKNKID
jgi:hypothetical protein